MNAIYHASSVLLTLSLIGFTLVTLYFLARPHVLNESKIVRKPLSRPKILLIGVLAILISMLSFSSVMSATEPTNSKQAQEAKQNQADEQDEKPITKTETKTEIIPFELVEQTDPTLPQGETRVIVEGVSGVRTITFQVTYVQGKETKREQVKSEITKEPITEVVKIGTYVAPPPPAPEPTPAPQASANVYYRNCSAARAAGAAPVYAGEPGYASHLDRDNDGVGCE